jgi:hypothetical protein
MMLTPTGEVGAGTAAAAGSFLSTRLRRSLARRKACSAGAPQLRIVAITLAVAGLILFLSIGGWFAYQSYDDKF